MQEGLELTPLLRYQLVAEGIDVIDYWRNKQQLAKSCSNHSGRIASPVGFLPGTPPEGGSAAFRRLGRISEVPAGADSVGDSLSSGGIQWFADGRSPSTSKVDDDWLIQARVPDSDLGRFVFTHEGDIESLLVFLGPVVPLPGSISRQTALLAFGYWKATSQNGFDDAKIAFRKFIFEQSNLVSFLFVHGCPVLHL